jgi:hypothetical protein
MIPIEFLQKIPLFDKVKPEYLAILANQAKPVDFYSGQEIVRQGELGNRFFVITKGIVNLRQTAADGSEKSIGLVSSDPVTGATLAVTPYFGEQMFATQEPYEFHAHAVMAVSGYVIARSDFDALIAGDPHLAEAFGFLKGLEHQRTHGYEWVGEGESVIAMYRKHWYVILPGLLRGLLAFCVVLLLGLIALVSGSLSLVLLVAFAVVVWVVIGIFIVYDWYNDEYVVTTARVAHMEREVFIQKELVESAPVDKIVAIKTDSQGIRKWLDVSTITMQTAGREEGHVTFEDVGHAAEIRKVIEAQRDRGRARLAAAQREKDRARVQQTLRDQLFPHVPGEEQAMTEAPAQDPAKPRRNLLRGIRNPLGNVLHLEERKGTKITWRKHWVVLWDQTYKYLIPFIVLNIVWVVLLITSGVSGTALVVLVVLGILMNLVFGGGVWWQWEDWRNDTYAITDTQIIDAERRPFRLGEKVITANLDQVQDVRVEVSDWKAQLLDYGDVIIETAGQGEPMIFHSIYDPHSASDAIFHRLEEYRTHREEKEGEIRSRGMVDALVGYDRLRREVDHRTGQSPNAGELPPPNVPPPEDIDNLDDPSSQ